MQFKAIAKSVVLNGLPAPLAAYLRKERGTWARQFMENRASAAEAVRSRTFTKALRRPITPKSVLWESFSGNGALCNPEALFRAMIDDPRFADFSHVWVLSSTAWNSPFRSELQSHPRVKFVRHRSAKYFETLESVEFLVNNATFPAEFIKRPEQTYLNVWHGTPLKKMGYDVVGGAEDARNILRNFLAADFLLSQNSFMTEQMYLSGYKLTNVFRGAIIEEGYPRTDAMFGLDAGHLARVALGNRGIETKGRKVLTYAPTWRGESFYRPNADASRLKSTLKALRSLPGLKDWAILLKAHQVIVDQLVDDPEFAEFLVPNDVPANEVLAITDVLVSDYSSIFVDYLATGRPVAFHIPDVDSYSSSRGLYITVDELPGPVSTTVEDLCDHVSTIVEQGGLGPRFSTEEDRYRTMKDELVPRDDGGAAMRVIDIVFGQSEDGRSVKRDFTDGRTTLMIYVGGMITNGITSSVLNLLNQLDATQYDVTVLFYRMGAADRRMNTELIPTSVRQVIRDPGILQLPLLGSMHRFESESRSSEVDDADDEHLWDWEWRRLFGDSRFDAAVDFSGYSAYWARIVAHSSAETKSIWLHNDLVADANREVDGIKPHLQNLSGVFRLFERFDSLVSVSSDLAEINRVNLAEYAAPEKFRTARNVINADRVFEGGGRSDAKNPQGEAYDLSNLAEAIEHLGALYSYDQVNAESTRQQLIGSFLGGRSAKTFVTVGRLSPEKNHARLIRAFAIVHREDPDTRLVIIGEGPLVDELKQLAVSLGVAAAVEFTGRLRNPYAIMSACGCFVMSSDYEGQPIVILEARVLGLPLVVTRFGSAESAVESSGGLIVDRDDRALAAGMRAFLAGEITPVPFDPQAYNRTAVTEFEASVFGR